MRFGGRGRIESPAPFPIGLIYFILDPLIRFLLNVGNSEVHNSPNDVRIENGG